MVGPILCGPRTLCEGGTQAPGKQHPQGLTAAWAWGPMALMYHPLVAREARNAVVTAWTRSQALPTTSNVTRECYLTPLG